MGNFEKLGILVIIVLVVVIIVLSAWGVAQDVDVVDTGEVPHRLDARGENGNGSAGQDQRPTTPPAGEVPPSPSGGGASPWPEDDRPGPGGNRNVPADPPAPVDDDPPSPAPNPDLTHEVKDGDSFWGLAHHYYRDGTKFPVIQEANPGVDQASLTVGMKLVIPHPDKVLGRAQRPAPASQPAGGGDRYVVKDGDSLWKIAENTLGRGSDYPKILDANRDLLGDDGDDLQVGMTLTIPR
jgi:nucleoid-associated protein YgaU